MKHDNGDSVIMQDTPQVPFVDTNIIPDRNAGIGSLLWDLQNPQDLNRDGPPLLDPEFAFIDVGVSRAKVSTALKTLLASDLKMSVNYVATELPEAVPYANVTLMGERAETIRGCLTAMFSYKETPCQVKDWQFVVDLNGKISSIAYSYEMFGNEIWESYFMGRTFMYSGNGVTFSNPALDEILATDVQNIEVRIELERKQDSDQSLSGPTWEGYRMEKNPLEEGLAEFGITLQKTDAPQRIKDKQNVLFLGNVLNHYPQDEQARGIERISANMKEVDLVIVQVDEVDACSIEVLKVKEQGDKKTLERVRWINTKKLEVRKHVCGSELWQQIHLKPGLGRIVSCLIKCLERKVITPKRSLEDHKVLVHQCINQVFVTFFRAMPVEETLRIAIREALRRLPSVGDLKGIPVFKDDVKDAYGVALELNSNPIVSEAELFNMKRELESFATQKMK